MTDLDYPFWLVPMPLTMSSMGQQSTSRLLRLKGGAGPEVGTSRLGGHLSLPVPTAPKQRASGQARQMKILCIIKLLVNLAPLCTEYWKSQRF